jgi:hypothetical protein
MRTIIPFFPLLIKSGVSSEGTSDFLHCALTAVALLLGKREELWFAVRVHTVAQPKSLRKSGIYILQFVSSSFECLSMRLATFALEGLWISQAVGLLRLQSFILAVTLQLQLIYIDFVTSSLLRVLL